jgi:hypothetical protein
MPEWLNGAVSKTVIRASGSRVRIPVSPLKIKMLFIKVFIFLNVIPFIANSQFADRLLLEGGVIGRVTVFEDSGVKRLQGRGGRFINYIPFTPDKGVNGLGINTTVGYKIIRRPEISVRAGTTFRYDFYFWDPSCNYCERKTTYFDQAFLLTKSIFSNAYFGIGYTMFNIGKIMHWEENGLKKSFPLHFNSVDVFVAFRVWKIMVEPKFSLVQSGFPSRVKNSGDILAMRIYYQFRL